MPGPEANNNNNDSQSVSESEIKLDCFYYYYLVLLCFHSVRNGNAEATADWSVIRTKAGEK